MSTPRVIFMGTPEFAVATLDALVADGIDVCAVVTAPDRPAGRGRQLRASAVKERAVAAGIPVLQPERLKAPSFLAELDAFEAALFVVVAFRMLPEVVWSRPPLGSVNLHGSLLPAYRGAAPINWAVINGETITGVTTFLIRQEIDTGDLLLQESTPIGPDETAGELHDRLMRIGANLMVRTVRGLFDGSLRARPQTMDANAHPPIAPKIDPTATRIHFHRPARQVHDLVRGMSPHPGAWCQWTDGGGAPVHCKVLRTRMVQAAAQGIPGSLHRIDDRLMVSCADHDLEILELQLEGRRRMSTAEFLHGARLTDPILLS